MKSTIYHRCRLKFRTGNSLYHDNLRLIDKQVKFHFFNYYNFHVLHHLRLCKRKNFMTYFRLYICTASSSRKTKKKYHADDDDARKNDGSVDGKVVGETVSWMY